MLTLLSLVNFHEKNDKSKSVLTISLLQGFHDLNRQRGSKSLNIIVNSLTC